jgi:hypothetical protein
LSISDYYILDVNSLSLSIINSSSIPNFNTSSRIIISASYSTIVALRYSINIAYFDSLSTITSIESILTFVRGSLDYSSLIIKSIVTTYYFFTGATLGYSFP